MRGTKMAQTINQIANRYEIISLVGQGGMADVYKAQDTILNRIVAIKILRQKLSEDPMKLVRFQREASAASRLSHPNVVDIYDVGEYNGMHYIVMEFIRGRTLKELIGLRGPLSVDEAVHIMRQLTSAIAHAHEHNIIHRDIKPQNILVKDDGTIKITDFGIAVANDAVQLTLNNAVMGSAHYLAPETAQGKDPDPKIDIYSMGIVFYELLTGSVPFQGKTPTEIAIKHLREPIPFVRDFNPGIPQSIENIVLKATAKNPAERYDSASDMLYELMHYNDISNRNVQRVTFKSQPVSNVEIDDDGYVKVEYEKPKKVTKKPKRSFVPYVLGALGTIIAIVLMFMIASLTGLIRFSGFLGYQTMPEVVSLTQEEALNVLEDANFDTSNVEIKEDVSDKFDEGLVISANYDEGEIIPGDADIVLTISKGPSFLVEDYTSRSLSEVQAELQAKGVTLNIEVEYQGAKDMDPGIILEQSGLNPGDRIDPDANETIRFVVSEYPTITIPYDLIGKDVNEAQAELNALGIAVLPIQQEGGSGSNIVVAVSPDVGSEYTQEGTDSVVTLYYD